MELHDFSYYVGSQSPVKNKWENSAREKDPNIFRSQPPEYVKRTALCFQKIAKHPERWKFYLKKYKVPRQKFKDMLYMTGTISETKIKVCFQRHHITY